MNNKLVKKLRRFAVKNYKITLDETLDTVCQENILHRLIFAFKVIFRIYKKKNKPASNKIESKTDVVFNTK